MKLDSIIYDVDSLAQAIGEQWATESEVFASMYPSDTATALVNGFAAYGAMLQYCLVSAMANCYTTTAFSETGIYQLAETLGNILHGNEPSQVTVDITKKNFLTMRTPVPANTKFTINEKSFFNPYGFIIPANNPTIRDITLIQGDLVEVTKTSTGLVNERFYFSSGFKASHNNIKVFVNGVEWQVKNSFLEYDKYYVQDINDVNVVILRTDPDGNSYIRVGDGQLGTLPPAGSTILIQYVSNEGANGNIQETNIEGELKSDITLIDNNGHQDTLQLEVITTSTAFGGFGKQSIATLRYTSPYVFASGHRAIRRQDYNAILQNECGYLTSSVWGEWEESNNVGAYDSLMMNMVYYTGLKSYEHYDYFEIGKLENGTSFDGTLYTTRGFWGSYSVKLQNAKDDTSYILITDNNAHGTMYINNDHLDARDSLLPEWIATASEEGVLIKLYGNETECIIAGGTGYKVNDILELYHNPENLNESNNRDMADGFYVLVTEVDSTTGYVSKVKLLTKYSGIDYTGFNNQTFSTYDRNTAPTNKNLQTEGSGCQIKLSIESLRSADEEGLLVTTNDGEGKDSGATQANPIENARSDQSDALFYQSLREPALNGPRQIRLNYGDIRKLGSKGIAAIKFKATSTSNGPFIGTVAMFGWNGSGGNIPTYENVRNSENWDCIINRTYLTNPLNDGEDGWTDWISTNCFKGTNDASGNPEFEKYNYFVIEFYSVENITDIDVKSVTFGKLKVLYDTDVSIIYYNSNGDINLSFPVAGSPGPGGTVDGYLTKSLLNNADRTGDSSDMQFPLYAYLPKIEGVNSANGYNNGNTLAYTYVGGNRKSLTFIVTVTNAANGAYSVTLDGSTTLVGEEEINMAAPISLDALPTYTLPQDKIEIITAGTAYRVNDVVRVLDTGSNNEITLRVARINTSGSVLALTPLAALIVGGDYSETLETEAITTGAHGTGLTVKLEPVRNSSGSGATISITSESNIIASASFIGNRIDTSDINKIDQSIIEKYNHFTTRVEFKQPEIEQREIVAQVAISNNAKVASSIVIQNVKTNLQKLFDITPDYMGKGLALSDIYKAISKTENVEWCRVLAPTDNILIRKNQLLVCKNIIVEEVTNTIK